MMLQSKIVDKKADVYKYVSKLKDVIEVSVDVVGNEIDTFDITRYNAMNDDFQLISNIEMLLPRLEDKIKTLTHSTGLIVYVEDFDDKYLFTSTMIN